MQSEESLVNRNLPHDKFCKNCGGVVKRHRRLIREYCSDECYAAKKRALRANPTPPICALCDREFVRNGNRQKVCSGCRDAKDLAYRTAYIRANKAALSSARKKRHAKERKEKPDLLRAQDRAWRERNKEEIRQRTHTEEFRAKARNRMRKLLRDSRHHNIHARMRGSIWASLKTGKGGQPWEALVGYTTSELISHIERQFSKGMSWENRSCWHIDHIRPRASFKFESYDDQGFKDCWALTNLQPLWADDNRRKGARLVTLV